MNRAGMAVLEHRREGHDTGSQWRSPSRAGSQASVRSVPLAGEACCLQLVPPTLATPRPPVTRIQEKEDTGFLPVLGVNKAQRKWEPAESGQRMGCPWEREA